MNASLGLRSCRVDRFAETFHDRVDGGPIDDEGRRNQHVVAADPVRRPSHGIDQQPTRHRFALDARVQPQFRVEWLLAAAIGDELDALEQAASAYVTDEGMIAEPLLEP